MKTGSTLPRRGLIPFGLYQIFMPRPPVRHRSFMRKSGCFGLLISILELSMPDLTFLLLGGGAFVFLALYAYWLNRIGA